MSIYTYVVDHGDHKPSVSAGTEVNGGKGCQETEKALLIVYCVGEGVEVYGHLRRLTRIRRQRS